MYLYVHIGYVTVKIEVFLFFFSSFCITVTFFFFYHFRLFCQGFAFESILSLSFFFLLHMRICVRRLRTNNEISIVHRHFTSNKIMFWNKMLLMCWHD